MGYIYGYIAFFIFFVSTTFGWFMALKIYKHEADILDKVREEIILSPNIGKVETDIITKIIDKYTKEQTE